MRPVGQTPGFSRPWGLADYQPAGMALRATRGDENPRGSGDFDEARKGWPGGQPRTRGSALRRNASAAARDKATLRCCPRLPSRAPRERNCA
jgi:hypothetical protein